MSVVATIISEDGAWIASDSCFYDDCSVYRTEYKKIFKHEDILIGVAGKTIIIHELRKMVNETQFNPVAKDLIDEDFVYTNFIDHLRDNDVVSTLDGLWNILINTGKKIFEIDNNFTVLSCELPYASIGVGHAEAIGSLMTSSLLSGKIPLNGTDLIRAINVSKAFNQAVRGQVQIIKL